CSAWDSSLSTHLF
nr:immunoglobulin light chain junction region [Macaca mulatta]MPO02965.1 immunoglobulin light chain junction region [Macaca mulatta]MPO02969.1 immunoglobulin light chain junction region [Macaca mulatta]MPO02979.1 immunoglobulin light chain junction region [Macaca mulatta]MPO03009.1 immunoglobulin light chain junction region [Macaca mulatta]